MPDVIVTGLPRSGATVAAALIDYLPNAVCLNSPTGQLIPARRLNAALSYSKWLIGDFAWQRRQLLAEEPIKDFRAADGMPLFDGRKDARRSEEAILFTRPGLKDDFILGMKHHTLYTALLPTLVKFEHFKIIAVIRHPVDVLLSWQAMGEPIIARGKPHGIGRFWPEALSVAESGGDALDVMAQLYELHVQRYHELREHIDIVKYEDMVADPMIISRLFGKKKLSAAAVLLEKRRRLRGDDVESIRQVIKKYGVFAKLYYDL